MPVQNPSQHCRRNGYSHEDAPVSQKEAPVPLENTHLA